MTEAEALVVCIRRAVESRMRGMVTVWAPLPTRMAPEERESVALVEPPTVRELASEIARARR